MKLEFFVGADARLIELIAPVEFVALDIFDTPVKWTTSQGNRLRPDKIGFAFHWAGISQNKYFTGQVFHGVRG